MHIAMFSHYCPPHAGGIETVVDALASRLSTRHRVTVVSSAWNGDAGVTRDGARTTWRLPAIHASERFGVPYPFPTGSYMREAMADAATADVVHAHGALYAQTMMARRVARQARRPLVLTEHVGWVPYAGAMLQAVQGAAWRLVGDATLAQSRAVVALNARVGDWLAARVPSCTPTLISNGVDLARFLPPTAAERAHARAALGLPADGVLGLFVGRDTPKKRRADVVAAPRAGWTLVLAGAPRSTRADGIVDLGVIAGAQMPLLYHACDFLVHAAEGEGFPLAVQEAMATSLPVALRWDPGYASTLARDVAPGADDIAGTLRAANALAADATLRATVAARGRAWATAHWSWDVTVAAYEALYARVIGSAA